MEPLVSIIMGAYNCEKTIVNCINSIIEQTYQNWEFIICDDCSTDNTFSILNSYKEKDKRIIIIHNEQNLKLAKSLNRCLSIAKGKYIARMDADDESLPERITKQVDFLEKHVEYDVVGCNMIVFDENGEKGIRTNVEFPNKDILLKNTPFAHPTIMMKKSVYDSLNGYTTDKTIVRAQDLELWFRFYEHNYKGYNMQENLYKYHESKDDLKKRNFKTGIQTSKIYWNGYKRINTPIYKRIYFIKPIVSVLIPNFIMIRYHAEKLK